MLHDRRPGLSFGADLLATAAGVGIAWALGLGPPWWVVLPLTGFLLVTVIRYQARDALDGAEMLRHARAGDVSALAAMTESPGPSSFLREALLEDPDRARGLSPELRLPRSHYPEAAVLAAPNLTFLVVGHEPGWLPCLLVFVIILLVVYFPNGLVKETLVLREIRRATREERHTDAEIMHLFARKVWGDGRPFDRADRALYDLPLWRRRSRRR